MAYPPCCDVGRGAGWRNRPLWDGGTGLRAQVAIGSVPRDDRAYSLCTLRPVTETESRVQLLGPVEIRDLAGRLGVLPTKKLGQNFVHDPNTVRRIVAAADLLDTDHVLEIGPGLGSLTLALLDGAPQVTAVEIDPTLATELPATIATRAGAVADNFRLVQKNALELEAADLEEVWAGSGRPVHPTAVVANLPYNVSVPVLLHVLALFPSIRRVLVMVQSEVADRLAAEVGNKIYGVPSVKARFYGEVRRAGSIGKNVFWPAPNVQSGLVRIDCGPRPWEQTAQNREALWAVVDAAFAQRRKTLRAALSGLYGSATAAEERLRAVGIDPQRRGETLTVEEFAALAGIMD